MGSKNVFALGFHADYRCRHSGACCTADWDVPVELPVYRSLSDALVGGRLRVAPTAGATYPFIVEPDLPDGTAAMLDRDERGHCVFYERDREALHRPSRSRRAASADDVPALSARVGPGSTRHVRLALALLSDGGVDAVSATGRSRSSPSRRRFLMPTTTVSSSPPTICRRCCIPRVLMDLDGYSAWERHMVGRCADVDEQPESMLATLMRDADLLRRWRPGSITLSEAVWELPHEAVDARAPTNGSAPSLHLRDEVIARGARRSQAGQR